MRLATLLVSALVAVCAGSASAAPPEFTASIGPTRWVDIRGTWRGGCPVPVLELRLVRLSYWGFDGRAHTGRIVVHHRVTSDVVKVFRRLYVARFPIHRMVPVSAYGGSDDASMAADNTSGFNCRRAVGSSSGSWSEHAFGVAVDVNPVENPYVLGGRTLPPAGKRYVDRTRNRPGMAVARGILVQAFAAAGWKWGGHWARTPDYQHFST